MLANNFHGITTTRRVALAFFTYCLIFVGDAKAYQESDFKEDWSSPFHYERSQNILKWGTGLTLLLVANRENFVDPLAEDIKADEPLGEFSKYGDLAGQTIPNLLYISYMSFNDDVKSVARAKLMFKATVFSGLTVFFLKRIINQKRPDGGDRNSHPSGHTTTAFAFASVVSLEHPSWSIPAYALASYVGLSRMNDHVHYLHDVVMGAAIGMAYGYAFYEKQNTPETVNYFISPLNDGAVLSINYRFD